MDISVFKSSAEIAPKLVRLYEGQKLYNLAEGNDPDATAELTSAVSDLLDVPLSGREEELLADVLITLTKQAESDLRMALSEKLATIDTVPLRLVLHLANDEIDIARPILTKSEVLSDLDLIYIVKAKGPKYWQAIAERGYISSTVIDVLADTKDVQTAITLSANERIRLTKHAIHILSDMAKSSDELARPLLSRKDLPKAVIQKLYAHVGQELRSYIETFHDLGKDKVVEKTIDDVILEFMDEPTSEYMPTDIMIRAAEKFAALGMLNTSMMLDVLKRGQIKSFVAMFSKYTGVSVKRVHDFLLQPCPKGLAIACRAFGIQKGEFTKMYLMTHRMRSASRVVHQDEIIRILEYFDKVRPEAAIRIIHATA